jgi:hypothetical protein
MSYNSFGVLFRVTTFGESHGPAIGASLMAVRRCWKSTRERSRRICCAVPAGVRDTPHSAGKRTMCKFFLVCSKDARRVHRLHY